MKVASTFIGWIDGKVRWDYGVIGYEGIGQMHDSDKCLGDRAAEAGDYVAAVEVEAAGTPAETDCRKKEGTIAAEMINAIAHPSVA